MEKINSYSEALFLIAKEKKREQEYLTALKDICSVFEENPEYAEYVSSYAVSEDKRIEAVRNAFSSSMPQDVFSFLCILCERHKSGQIKLITDEYEKLYFAQEGISKVRITSAYPLDEKQKERLIFQLEKKYRRKTAPEFFTDKALIGGIKIEIDGSVIDSSVINRLNKLREVMDK